MGEDDLLSGVIAWLMGRSHLMAPEEVPDAAQEAARRLGATACRIHLVTRDQRSLRPLLARGTDDEVLGLEARSRGGPSA